MDENEKTKKKVTARPKGQMTEEMPVLALRGLVLFPNMILHFDVGREKSVMALNEAIGGSRRIFLVTQRDFQDNDPDQSQLYQVGVVAEVRQIIRVQSETLRVLVEGKHRAKLMAITQQEPFLAGLVVDHPTRSRVPNRSQCDALMRAAKDLFRDYCDLSPKMPKELVLSVVDSTDPLYLSEYITANINIDYDIKQSILEESSVTRRLEMVIRLLEEENEILNLEQSIQERVREQMDKNQREYYLREQMKIISEELGESENSYEELDNYRARILSLKLPAESESKLLKELERLGRMPGSSQEGSVLRVYLDTVLDLPWNVYTRDKIDIDKARRLLDREHYGLQKVKERVLESLAVRKLSPQIKGQILCLVGPPGVGKTSIARSIAKSMGRKYVRMSLGGVRDESDIRGHRKTYVASMPGRIIAAIKQAGSSNPLLLLDEVDKLGHDFRGDPSSALLEVLDAEQNSSFRDHFLEIPYDLSQVFFIATANDRSAIPAPLLDRMEVIELASYTREEKLQIAKRHLVGKQRKRHGLDQKQLAIPDKTLYTLIDHYTREAGVRTLERAIASICRKAAMKVVEGGEDTRVKVAPDTLEELLGPRKYRDDQLSRGDQVGIANGLAWTAVGGEMLQVETAIMEGTGKHQSTGSLGDVMKESVAAAITYIRTVARQYGISDSFYKDRDIHIHFPEGAVPKDGPSAGITTCTALVSALSGIPVRHDVAMTGEVTLRGRVLPIGGLREKTMAAYKHGMKQVIIPAANLPDLAEVDPVVKEAIQFVPAETMETVLRTALLRYPQEKHSATPAERELTIPPESTGASTPLRQ